MKEPCRSCSKKGDDFGGCRCQAYLLTGDAANTDPVCSRSDQRDLIAKAHIDSQGEHVTEESGKSPLLFRNSANSKLFS
jgi:pyrroloquinoline quinone biosynthesis protein E